MFYRMNPSLIPVHAVATWFLVPAEAMRAKLDTNGVESSGMAGKLTGESVDPTGP